MRILLLIATLLLGLSTQAQLTSTGMNGVEMDMTRNTIEQIIGEKVAFTDDHTPVRVKINGILINIIFHTYMDQEQHVYRMSCISPALKTAEGIGLGSSLDNIWRAYHNAGAILILNKEFHTYEKETADKLVYIYTKRPDDDGYYNYLCSCMRKDSVYKIIISRTEDYL